MEEVTIKAVILSAIDMQCLDLCLLIRLEGLHRVGVMYGT
jgi:hypothetical protein